MASETRENQPLLVDDSSEDEHQIQRNHTPEIRDEEEEEKALHQSVESRGSAKELTKVYKRRWYILFLFSLFSATFSTIWNCWGPISAPAEAAFGWSDSTIALQTNLGPIAYMASGFVLPWFLQNRGLRLTVLGSSFIMSIGTMLRSITSYPPAATILISIGQGCNGLIGPMAMAAIPQVSSLWFPPSERVTATSISNSFCIFGYAIAYLIGPALVSEVNETSLHNHSVVYPNDALHLVNLSDYSNTTLDFFSEAGGASPVMDVMEKYDTHTVNKAQTEIMRYMYIECGWSWLLFIVMLIYFPAHPPLPPGLSAVAQRDDYWKGLWSLKGKFGYLLVAFSYGISSGVSAGWAALLSVILRPFDVSLDESGWIGFGSITGACVISLMLCRFVDYFIRHIKLFILLMFTLGSIAFLIFALMTASVISFNKVTLYFSVIAGFTFTNGVIPLLFELACEQAYPTSESASNGFLTFLNNLFCLLFLLLVSVVTDIDAWINWVVMGCTFVCIPMISVLKNRFNRLDLDEEILVTADSLSPVGDDDLSNGGIPNVSM